MTWKSLICDCGSTSFNIWIPKSKELSDIKLSEIEIRCAQCGTEYIM